MLSFLLLCLVLKVSADDVNALTLWMASGKKVVCMLDEQPVVTFRGDELVLSTHMNVMSYSAADVLRFTHSYVDPAGIAVPETAEAGFVFDGSCIKAFNLEPMSEIEVYSVDAVLQAKAIADVNGSICIYIPARSGDVFIVKTPVANFKIMKQ